MAENTYWRGLVTGLMIGAGTALILAQKKTDSGESELVEGIGNLKEKASDVGSGAIEVLSDKIADAKSKITNLRATDDDNVEELLASDEVVNEFEDVQPNSADALSATIDDNLDDETSQLESK